jgi:hypothetical protein
VRTKPGLWEVPGVGKATAKALSHEHWKKTTSSLQDKLPSAPFLFVVLLPHGIPAVAIVPHSTQPSVAAAPGRHRHVVNTFGVYMYRTIEAPCHFRMLPRLNSRFTVSATPGSQP